MGTLTAVPTSPPFGLVVWMIWRRYLTSTRDLVGEAYELAEEEAWLRLTEELAGLGLPPGNTLRPAA